MTDERRAFFDELIALCAKHNVKDFSGCNCCGSPWVAFQDGTSFDLLLITATGARGRDLADDTDFEIGKVQIDEDIRRV